MRLADCSFGRRLFAVVSALLLASCDRLFTVMARLDRATRSGTSDPGNENGVWGSEKSGTNELYRTRWPGRAGHDGEGWCRKSFIRLPCVVSALLLASCDVGPKYEKPATPMSGIFKEATPAEYQSAGVWRPAHPNDTANRGKWWQIFGDPELNKLEDELSASNQNLKVAEARFRQARAMIGFQRAAEFPTISTGVSTTVLKESGSQPYFGNHNPGTTGELQLPFDLSYEVDLWGAVRRAVSAAREEAQATAADLETVGLSLHAELALDYIELRSADAQQRLLDDTVKAYTDALRVTRNRLAGGFAPVSDVAQAETQLDTTKVEATDIGVMRAQFEHAIAVLIGQPPAAFSLPPAPLNARPPPIAAGIPSELLQQRPDIAAAERRVAEANDQIGIAKAAYYPSVNLNAMTGFEGITGASWFAWPSLFWAIGPAVTQPLFDGGKLHAQSQQVQAAYDAAVANYRQTTLTAFQEVEDNLAALRILDRETGQQREAVAAAENALRIFNNLYVGGSGTYLQVITAQEFALTNRRNDVDIVRRRMEASVRLVKALGGDWNVASLPALEEHGLPRGAVVPLGQ